MLHIVIFWFAALISTITMGLIAYSLLRLRFQSSPDTPTAPGFSNNVFLEIVWTVIPTLILFALLVLTYQAM
jgi:cytochrome c oxidase subunit 2